MVTDGSGFARGLAARMSAQSRNCPEMPGYSRFIFGFTGSGPQPYSRHQLSQWGVAMQINRVSDPFYLASLTPPPGSPADATAAPAAESVPTAGAGVTYTGAGNADAPAAPASIPDLSTLSLASQLELGKNMGVFTKVTISKDAQLLAKADSFSGISSSSFATSAAATMQDMENGFAVLKQNSASAALGNGASLAGKFRNLQQLAGKLNVFA